MKYTFILAIIFVALFATTAFAKPTYEIVKNSLTKAAFAACEALEDVEIAAVIEYEDKYVFTVNSDTDDVWSGQCRKLLETASSALVAIKDSKCFEEKDGIMIENLGVEALCPGKLKGICDTARMFCGDFVCTNGLCLFPIPENLPIIKASLDITGGFLESSPFFQKLNEALGECKFDFTVPNKSGDKVDLFYTKKSAICLPQLIIAAIDTVISTFKNFDGLNFSVKVSKGAEEVSDENMKKCFDQNTGEVGCKTVNKDCPIACANSAPCTNNKQCGSGKCVETEQDVKTCQSNAMGLIVAPIIAIVAFIAILF